MKKKRVLMISDGFGMKSGIGNQTESICKALLDTGRYKIFLMGGVTKEKWVPEMAKIQQIPGYPEWTMQLTPGYGPQAFVRPALTEFQPDVTFLMGDPRYLLEPWMMNREIKKHCPIVYYHVWDNLPMPVFNESFYRSNSKIVSISKLTQEVLDAVVPDMDTEYLPHAVDPNIFSNTTLEEKKLLREGFLKASGIETKEKDTIILFSNNVNSERKQLACLLQWFREFLDSKSTKKRVLLTMHTNSASPSSFGANLEAIIKNLGLKDDVMISTSKVEDSLLARFYKIADCTINIANAEGFGLATLESLSCGTPIIASKTGGLTPQIEGLNGLTGIGVDGEDVLISNSSCNFIFKFYPKKESFLKALRKICNMSQERRHSLGEIGSWHARDVFGFSRFQKEWVRIFDELSDSERPKENLFQVTEI